MIYKDFKGMNISQLGMGNMRLPTKGDPMTDPIDYEKAEELIDYVYKNGVNYFDTAYLYHGGNSEKFLGEVMKKYPRDSYFLADKMWGMLMREGKTVEDVFEEQLTRCQVDYFDFYLLHDIAESTYDIYMDKKYGIVKYLLEQKKAGRICYFGFSSHAKPDTLKRFLDHWDCFEFAQIQLNYLDWTLQDAKSQYEILLEHDLAVWVMEPCRGGRLASLNPKLDEMLLRACPDKTIASWAFRWLQTLPNVQVVLSGMTTLGQAKNNIETFSEKNLLSEEEMQVLEQVVEQFKGKINIPCTKCYYCDGCPKGLDIPGLLASYNEFCVEPYPVAMLMGFNIPEGKRPADCIACGICSKKCPQHIDIPGTMKKFVDGIENLMHR